MNHLHFQRWGAVYLLLALFAASWGGQFLMTMRDVTLESQQHGEAFEWGALWATFLSATFENWQSEWLQLVLQAVVLLGMKHKLFAADAEDMEIVQRDLIEIRQALGLPRESPGEHHITGPQSPAAS